jgi:hypothetical protein
VNEADLRSVDELCRLVLAARRLGCRVHLSGVDPELRGLLALAGVDAVVTAGGGVGSRPHHCRGMLRAPAPTSDGPVP